MKKTVYNVIGIMNNEVEERVVHSTSYMYEAVCVKENYDSKGLNTRIEVVEIEAV